MKSKGMTTAVKQSLKQSLCLTRKRLFYSESCWCLLSELESKNKAIWLHEHVNLAIVIGYSLSLHRKFFLKFSISSNLASWPSIASACLLGVFSFLSAASSITSSVSTVLALRKKMSQSVRLEGFVFCIYSLDCNVEKLF